MIRTRKQWNCIVIALFVALALLHAGPVSAQSDDARVPAEFLAQFKAMAGETQGDIALLRARLALTSADLQAAGAASTKLKDEIAALHHGLENTYAEYSKLSNERDALKAAAENAARITEFGQQFEIMPAPAGSPQPAPPQ